MRGAPYRGVLAEFTEAAGVRGALARLREAGYTRLDTFSPYELEEAEGALGMEAPPISWWGFAAAAAGAALGYGIQWYTSAWDYPLIVGSRPLNSVPAWIPIAFVIAVLFGAVAVFVGLWVHAQLPALWHPIFEVDGFERATVDRFWIAVGAEDERYHPLLTADALRNMGAVRVVHYGRSE
jgi:hypothetical protein